MNLSNFGDLSDSDNLSNLNNIGEFISDELHINYFGKWTRDRAMEFLNRPLRVCGLVKNQGEPGGGLFIVDNGDYSDMQICEKSELDLSDAACSAMLSSSEYFDPVDLVCFVKDYKGRKLKALEHPGLWNVQYVQGCLFLSKYKTNICSCKI